MAEHLTVITPELFQYGMNKLLMRCKEPSFDNANIYHTIYEGVQLMCTTLSQLGYSEGIETFERLCMTPKSEESHRIVTFLN